MSLITLKQAGEILNRPKRTIQDWVKNGVLKSHRIKSYTYLDSDTIYALKDTEKDIEKALKARDELLKDIESEIEMLRAYIGVCHKDTKRLFIFFADTIGKDMLDERHFQILHSIVEGKKCCDIAKSFGIKEERVGVIALETIRTFSEHIYNYATLYSKFLTYEKENESLKNEVLKLKRDIALTGGDEDGCFPEEIRQMQFDDIFSTRTKNCLYSAGINTIGDLLRISRNSLMNIRNFGENCLREIDEFYQEKGLKFGYRDLRWNSQSRKCEIV